MKTASSHELARSRRRFGSAAASLAALLLVLPAAPAWAEGDPVHTDICTYDSGTLTVTLPATSGATLTRGVGVLTVEYIDQVNPGFELFVCGDAADGETGVWAIGDGTDEIREVEVVGQEPVGPYPEVVIFADATAAIWGANSLSNLYRSVTGVETVQMDGTSGNDVITATTFVDVDVDASFVLIGEEGDDTLTAAGSDDSLIGGEGSDILRGAGGNDTLSGGPGDDALQGYSGVDTADYQYETDSVTVDLTSGKGSGTSIGNDTYSSIEYVLGGSGDDVLQGSAYGDTFFGGAGDDILRGRGGADYLDGGEDVDTATYSEQTYAVSVQLSGGSSGAAGSDSLHDLENLVGGSAADTLVGNAADNMITGGAGADVLVGMGGDDTLDGGTGVDTVSYDGGLFGGAASGAIEASLVSGTATDTAGTPEIEDDAVDTITGVENLNGSSYADTLTGTTANNIIKGMAGDDTVYAGGGNDNVNGGPGEDTLYGEAGNDTMRGDFDDDTIYGGAGADPIWGDTGDDKLCGGLDGDTLRGGDGDDTLVGGFVGGGGTGVDVMYGDDGTGDTISYDNAVCGGSGAESDPITFRLGAVATQQKTGGAGVDVNGGGVENLTGGSGADTLVGDGDNNIIRGLGGNDTIQGGVGDDTMYSGAGSNKVDGQLGTNDRCLISDGGTWSSTKNCDAFS